MRRKSKQTLPPKYLLFALSVLCVVMIIASFAMDLSNTPLNNAVGLVFTPMQKGINTVGDWTSEKIENLKNIGDVLSENEELKAEVVELNDELNSMQLEQSELENLRELLELDEKYPSYEKTAAYVISKDAGNWFSTFTIDKGTDDGIEVDMNVISGNGLVGIVTSVGKNYATVRSIIDDNSEVSAMVLSTEDLCIVHGNLQNMEDNQEIKLSGLKDQDNEVEVGAQIVTSNVSDKYLPGILVGYVSTLDMDSNNITKSGTVTPVVDFEHLQSVLVIMEKKTQVSDTEEQ
ncbi:MAG: rod shape-determining protein MreC [Lachnospiraceae bacterium]|nr:rod shape-determining protein MreC [Lachnospiraceae bacterium]